MNVLIYNASPFIGVLYNALLNEINENINKGNHVVLVNCDGRQISRVCIANVFGIKSVCVYCRIINRICQREVAPFVERRCLSDFEIKTMKQRENSDDFPVYNSLSEIKNIEYKGVNIGLGCVSLYVYLTRNMDPEIDKSFRRYMDGLLADSMRITDRFLEMTKTMKCDRYAFVNGRFPENRPLYEILRSGNAHFKSIEVIAFNGICYKEVFENSIPQDMSLNHERVIKAWNKPDLSVEEKEKLGAAFFEGKKRGESLGDKSYTKDQIKNLLPEEYDSSKMNIVIFNSSEDEYFSIDKDSPCQLYSSQLEAYRDIVEKFKDNERIHFYLRIHPNLMDIRYNYHTDLYLLSQYPNVTVIPADSKISSYHLLDVADKVIVYISSMGMEAAYANKPVILLSKKWLYGEDIAYVPQSRNELYRLIGCNLKCKSQYESLKYGFYFQNRRLSGVLLEKDNQPEILDFKMFKYFNLKNRKIFGSNILFMFFDIMARTLMVKIPNEICRLVRNIPCKEKI